MNEQLAAALAAEAAAIYAYGVSGCGSPTPGRKPKRATPSRPTGDRRDYLVGAVGEPGRAPGRLRAAVPGNRPGDGAEAGHPGRGRGGPGLAAGPAGRPGARPGHALAALIDAAVRATRWRRLAEVSPVTMAFPGAPE